jgi:hypothetical protein
VLTCRGWSTRLEASVVTIDDLKQLVLHAGVEIYRATNQEIRIAERVRMHLMDSGVALCVSDAPEICLTIRSQRSDFPAATEDALLQKVREAILPIAHAHGFRETRAASRNVTDPMDEAHLLDVWYELTFTKQIRTTDTLIADLRWALSLPKCIVH